MKASILIATSSLRAVQASQGSIVNDGCEAIKWNGEKIPFQLEEDNTIYMGDTILEKYEERKEELSLGRCMRKCFRYAGCVAFNFYETGNFDICELFSKIVPTRENITGHKVTRGFFSDTCGAIDNFTDYRLSRDVSLVFKKKAIEVPQEMQDELLSNVLQANSLDPAQNGEWQFSTLHHKHDRDIGFSDRYEFSMREYRRDYFTFCEFNFKLDKIARIKSIEDYSENISDFFGSDDDIFVENLFDFDWPDMDGILELYDIVAPPSNIEIKTAGNNSGLGGRSSDKKDGKCFFEEGKMKCSCATGLDFKNGQCQDIDECQNANQCSSNEECYNYRGSFLCIEYPNHSSFTKAAGQRMAILVSRIKETRSGFNYSDFMASVSSLLQDLEAENYNEQNGSCIQPINFDSHDDTKTITRSADLEDWFTVLYKRIYWMFRFCDGVDDQKKYQKRLKKIARRVQKGLIQDYTFFNLTDAEMEEKLTTDYNEANYDEYFEEREEKIERGDILVKDYDVMNESVSQFEAIDWSIFGDYTDYYYDY